MTYKLQISICLVGVALSMSGLDVSWCDDDSGFSWKWTNYASICRPFYRLIQASSYPCVPIDTFHSKLVVWSRGRRNQMHGWFRQPCIAMRCLKCRTSLDWKRIMNRLCCLCRSVADWRLRRLSWVRENLQSVSSSPPGNWPRASHFVQLRRPWDEILGARTVMLQAVLLILLV